MASEPASSAFGGRAKHCCILRLSSSIRIKFCRKLQLRSCRCYRPASGVDITQYRRHNSPAAVGVICMQRVGKFERGGGGKVEGRGGIGGRTYPIPSRTKFSVRPASTKPARSQTNVVCCPFAVR